MPSTKIAEYKFIRILLKSKPVNIRFHGNCKYREIAVKYKHNDFFIYIYFLEERKTNQLSYVGYLNSTDNKDPTLKGTTAYDPQEFQDNFGFQAPFSKNAVRTVFLRENSVFRRKTIVVRDGNSKVSKYFMYFKLSENRQ